MKEYRLYHLALVYLALAGLCLGLAGCGSSEVAEPKCTDDFECAYRESCDIDRGVCVPIDMWTPADASSTPECTSNAGCPDEQICNSAGECEAGDVSDAGDATPNEDTDADADVDADVDACDPACADDETCTDGACVPNDPTVCNPACSVEEHCDNNVCVSNASDPNACRPTCASDETCYSGTCVSNNYPSCDLGCSVEEHCENGLCIPNAMGGCNPVCGEGEFCEGGECVPAAPGPDGQPCTLWAADSGCPSGEVCAVASNFEGHCTASIDPAPTALGDSCSPDYDTCGVYVPSPNANSEAFSIACFQVGAADFSCLMHCRIGNGDCDRLEGYGDGGVYESYECTAAGYFPRYSNIGVCSRSS